MLSSAGKSSTDAAACDKESAVVEPFGLTQLVTSLMVDTVLPPELGLLPVSTGVLLNTPVPFVPGAVTTSFTFQPPDVSFQVST
jgi:hypothetical protein